MGVAELGGLGAFLAALVGAFVAFFKLKPEAGSILIKSANDVVVIQRGLIDELKADYAECKERQDRLEAALVQEKRRSEAVQRALEEDVAELSTRLQLVTDERDGLRGEADRLKIANAKLLERVDALEAEVARLKAA